MQTYKQFNIIPWLIAMPLLVFSIFAATLQTVFAGYGYGYGYGYGTCTVALPLTFGCFYP